MNTTNSNGYRLTIKRDESPDNPLDMTDAPVSEFYAESRYPTLTAAQQLVVCLHDTGDLEDWINTHRDSRTYLDIADMNPLGLDWYALDGCHPDDEPTTDYSSEAADNAALLEWAGIPQTRENIYTDDLPAELVSALFTYLTSKYVIRCPNGGYDRNGSTYLYTEAEEFIKYAGCDAAGVVSSMDGIEEEYEACQDGNVWGYTLTRALFDDEDEWVEDVEDVEDVSDCWGFYGATPDCITSSGYLPEAVAEALKAHCGSWLEECVVDIFDQVEETA